MKRLRFLPLLAVLTGCLLAARWPAGASVAPGNDEQVYGIAEVENESVVRDLVNTAPLRTHASGKWLNGYSDHFPTEIFLIAK